MTKIELDAAARRRGIYVASKVTHAEMWRDLRHFENEPIISTWIDEAGAGESASLEDLWRRCISEASGAGALIVYRRPDEVLKGAWVELGAALASGVPVFAVGIEEFTVARHAGIVHCDNLVEARRLARKALSASKAVPVPQQHERWVERAKQAGAEVNETPFGTVTTFRHLDELISFASARSIDAGDGYVLVPREPTEAMKTAGMDVLMYRIETITPSDLWRAMLAAAPSPPPAKKVGPTTNAAAFELSIYEGVRDRLARLTAGTCSCNTKSPELRYHSERCHYRVAREALDLLLAAPPPAAKEAE